MKVAIIGAGIAGLTMAIALKKAKIPFVIYESASEIKPVGAGIAIANNAMQVYRYLGIADHLQKVGMRISTVLLTDVNLNTLTKSDLQKFEELYQLGNIAIHRSELHRVLIENVGVEHIVLSKRLNGISRINKDKIELNFTDNSTKYHSFVIGADGIRSQVRQLFFGNYPLRDAKQICWRGVLNFELPARFKNTALEGWGKAKRFGFVQLDEKQVYWYFLINEDLYNEDTELIDLLNGCNDLVKSMILNTQNSTIFKDKIYDLSLVNNWYKNNVAIIGDAAHATTPNLGQGACQAIEDVYVISKLLETTSLENALQQFTSIRRAKAHAVVKDSWQLGQIAQLRHPLLIGTRNFAFKILPSFVKEKQMKTMFQLQKI